MRWFDIIAFVCKAPKVHEVVKLTASGPPLFACIYYKLYMQQIWAVMGQNVKQGVDFAVYFLLNTVVWHYNFFFFYCFTSWYLTIWYFIFVYLIFVSLIVLYFLHSTSVLLFYLNVVLLLSITALAPKAPKLQEAVKITASGPLLVFCKYYKLYIEQIWERSHLYLGRGGSESEAWYRLYSLFLSNTMVCHYHVCLRCSLTATSSQDNGLWPPLHSFANIINSIYYEFQNDNAIA